MELASVNGEVGRQYTKSTSSAETKSRPEAALNNLGSEQVQGCTHKSGDDDTDEESGTEGEDDGGSSSSDEDWIPCVTT